MDVKSVKALPINIALLRVQETDLPKLGEVSDAQIFDNTGNFLSTGLFSVQTFGAVGSEIRNRTFGYINMKMTILHPLVYFTITKLKAFYKQIAEGKVTAIFDPKTKEFIKSNEPHAQTGYNFFISHIEELKFERNESDTRNFLIELFNKAVKENTHKMQYVLVLPAGLRDYTVDANGKPQEDEINTFYRKIIAQASIVDPIAAKKTPEVYDNIAIGLQNANVDLFDYIKSLLEGKNKLILGKWLSRKIFNSTRNVLSSNIDKSLDINSKSRLGYNECLVGLHQFARAAVPKSTFEIRNKYIKDIFIDNSTSAYLTNAKTLKKEEIFSSHIQKEYDMWTSSDGIEKIIAMLGNLDYRNQVIQLNKGKHYMGLVYRDEKYFKFFQDIDELPEGYNKDNVSPVTLAEFIYLSLYHLSGKYPGFVTRYPITGFGSIYPCFVKVSTTVESYEVEELDDQWQPTGQIAYSFPNKNSDYNNVIAVHPGHIGRMGADFKHH